jgi:hypothetical protein
MAIAACAGVPVSAVPEPIFFDAAQEEIYSKAN